MTLGERNSDSEAGGGDVGQALVIPDRGAPIGITRWQSLSFTCPTVFRESQVTEMLPRLKGEVALTAPRTYGVEPRYVQIGGSAFSRSTSQYLSLTSVNTTPSFQTSGGARHRNWHGLEILTTTSYVQK
jgi:hypothetical protein